MRQFLFLICLGLSTIAFAKTPSTRSLQQTLNQIRQQYHASAASLSIKINNKPITSTYSGNLGFKRKIPVNRYTLFQFGSITKSFIATLMLKLQAQGLLKLNDPITKFLPQYSKWKHIKIKNILDHTSGIYNFTTSKRFDHFVHSNLHHQFSKAYLVGIAYRHPLAFTPGEGYLYSNTDYILAGMIIEKLSGYSVHDLLESQILNPLNLSSTYYIPGAYSNSLLNNMPTAYEANGHNVSGMNMSWISSAGSIVSTTADMTQWVYDLFNHQTLSNTEFKQMTTLVSQLSGQPTNNIATRANGLGIQRKFFSDDIGVVWYHPGGTTGFASMMVWIPKKHIAFSIAINREVNSVAGIENLADPIINLFQANAVQKNIAPGKQVYPMNVSASS